MTEADRQPCRECGRPTLPATLRATGGLCRKCRPGRQALMGQTTDQERRGGTSVERGRAFEEQVYDALVKELHDGRLGLLPSSCSVHLRKGYFSRDRGREIVIDVSIEMRLPGAD